MPVAFTPKGGCPLKHATASRLWDGGLIYVAFTPKGGCPLKQVLELDLFSAQDEFVAFTPKGGWPLKRDTSLCQHQTDAPGSIHPQGWVPIETRNYADHLRGKHE